MSNNIVFNEHYAAVMARYPDKYFDIATCDIPYGKNIAKMHYLYENKSNVVQSNGAKHRVRTKKIHTLKEWDLQPPPQEYFNELVRISNHQIIFGAEYTNWEGMGPGTIRWDKGVAEGASYSRYETAYCTTLDIKIMLKSDGIDISSECFQYLVQKGYAVHLFFGVNHWANGMDAISLGIAINKNQK